MRIRTLVLYLIGNRQAILDLAADRSSLWIGLVFVLSASFAREYDGEDLLHEPWHLLLPVGASLAASFLLFLVVWFPLIVQRAPRPPFLTAYRAFLTLFWMTAPLAWLYAVPYERFLSPGAATKANLWTLALVAAWRVALMVRVVSVLTARSIAASLYLVMAFADVVALTAISLMPKPVFSIMGGIRLTESEEAVLTVTIWVLFLGILSAPVWGLGAVIAIVNGEGVWQAPASPATTVSAGRGLWILAALSLVVWLPILPWTQPEQQLRSRVEEDMRAGRIVDALATMSAHAHSDFPPQWEPPPRLGYGDRSTQLFEVLETILDHDVAEWVRAAYLDKLRRYLGRAYRYQLISNSSAEQAALIHILKRLPEGPSIVNEHREAFEMLSSFDKLPAAEREELKALLNLVEKYDPPKR